MANVIINDSNLIAIGNAIREKNGTEDTYKPREMAEAILAITTGGGGSEDCTGMHIPEDGLTITGDCSSKFAENTWDWFIEQAGNKIVTKDITNVTRMFQNSDHLTSILFDINFKDGGGDCERMFYGCKELTSVPAIDFKHTSTYKSVGNLFNGCEKLIEIGSLSNLYPSSMTNMFNSCRNLRYLPTFNNLNLDRMYTYATASMGGMFSGCYSLRSIPEDFLKQLKKPTATSYTTLPLYQGFLNCSSLDEIRGLNPQSGGAITSNIFGYTFGYCTRVKDIIFALQEDGTPYSVNWSRQTIDLTSCVGYANHTDNILNYNSGITVDKQVTNDATYQALKNDPDWFTTNIAYSRYNHDSAVNTINSLPITTNTGCVIKFTGASGSATDGGAINTLTEEEIAVAAAKGWTVTLV